MRVSTTAAGLCPAWHQRVEYLPSKQNSRCSAIFVLPAMFAMSIADIVTGFFQGVLPSLPSAAKFAIVIPLLYGSF